MKKAKTIRHVLVEFKNANGHARITATLKPGAERPCFTVEGPGLSMDRYVLDDAVKLYRQQLAAVTPVLKLGPFKRILRPVLQRAPQ